jgi:hypothetical protein
VSWVLDTGEIRVCFLSSLRHGDEADLP